MLSSSIKHGCVCWKRGSVLSASLGNTDKTPESSAYQQERHHRHESHHETSCNAICGESTSVSHWKCCRELLCRYCIWVVSDASKLHEVPALPTEATISFHRTVASVVLPITAFPHETPNRCKSTGTASCPKGGKKLAFGPPSACRFAGTGGA